MELVTPDEATSERVKQVRLRAENPDNWRFGEDDIPDENYVVRFEPDCQVVYTVDMSKERPWKHLSVSAWDENEDYIEVPPFHLFVITKLFGFVLADGNSLVTPDKDNPKVIHALEPFDLGRGTAEA